MMKNVRRTSAGKEASEHLARLKVATRTGKLSKATRQRTIGRKEDAGPRAGAGERFKKFGKRTVKRGASSVAAAARPENTHDATGKVESWGEQAARSGASRAVDRVPGAGTMVRTVSSRNGLYENTEAVGQAYGKHVARKAGLRSARVAGRLGKRSALAAGRGVKAGASAVSVASRRTGAVMRRVAARAAARATQAAVGLFRAVAGVVASTMSAPVVAVAVAGITVIGLIFSLLAAVLPGVVSNETCTDLGEDVQDVSYAGYNDPTQRKNASEIIRAGRAAGLQTRDITIGVMTAIGESGLRILAYGDAAGPDSRGLFQQRDSWGPLSTRMDAYGSAELFFTALKKVPNRDATAPTLVAHAVQINADAQHYAKFWAAAVSVVAGLGGGTAAACDPTFAGIPGSLGKGDDYPYKSGIYNANNDITGFAIKNCTDFAWWRVMQQLGITDPTRMDARPLGPGNGATWGFAWKRAGWTVTMTPKVGAVIWYGPGNPGGDPTFGHVAVVKAITKDGKVLEEGYNMAPDKLGAYYTRTIDPKSPSGYLLIPTKDQFAQAA